MKLSENAMIDSKLSYIHLNPVHESVITRWLKQYNLRKTQYLAGHQYLSSTEAYQKSDLEGLQEVVQKYLPLG